MSGDLFPAENLSKWSFYSFSYIYLFWFQKCASENNSSTAVRIVIKFHAASVPLGRDTLI